MYMASSCQVLKYSRSQVLAKGSHGCENFPPHGTILALELDISWTDLETHGVESDLINRKE
jgi:hypothetical protein